MDNEVSGTGNQYDYGFRIYNPRIGKFLSVDPLTAAYPWNSTYAYAENSPIAFVDLDGLERYFAADGSYIGKIGDSDNMRILKKDANYIELKKQGSEALINGSYSTTQATNEVYSKVATKIFFAAGIDKGVKLYNNKVSSEWNNVPSIYPRSIRGNADSYYYLDEGYGIVNLIDKDANYYDLVNIMRHEQHHNFITKDKNTTKANNKWSHFDIYMTDMAHWSFEKTTKRYQLLHRKNALGLLDDMSEALLLRKNKYGENSGKYTKAKDKYEANVKRYEKKFDTEVKRVDFWGNGTAIHSDPNRK